MVCHQSDKDIVDEVDLIIGILIGADQEKIGEVPQHHRLPLVGAVRDRAVELLDEFQWSAHAPWRTVLVGHGLGGPSG
jgi:DNA-nicking Smr family endonuclease